jgi:hypothetical protein
MQDSERLSTERPSRVLKELKEGFGNSTLAAPDHARLAPTLATPHHKLHRRNSRSTNTQQVRTNPTTSHTQQPLTAHSPELRERWESSTSSLLSLLTSSSSFPCQSPFWFQSAQAAPHTPQSPSFSASQCHNHHGHYTYRSFTQTVNIGSSSRTLRPHWTCWHHKTQAQAYNHRLWCV